MEDGWGMLKKVIKMEMKKSEELVNLNRISFENKMRQLKTVYLKMIEKISKFYKA
jgi:hypothetical protein